MGFVCHSDLSVRGYGVRIITVSMFSVRSPVLEGFIHLPSSALASGRQSQDSPPGLLGQSLLSCLGDGAVSAHLPCRPCRVTVSTKPVLGWAPTQEDRIGANVANVV